MHRDLSVDVSSLTDAESIRTSEILELRVSDGMATFHDLCAETGPIHCSQRHMRDLAHITIQLNQCQVDDIRITEKQRFSRYLLLVRTTNPDPHCIRHHVCGCKHQFP